MKLNDTQLINDIVTLLTDPARTLSNDEAAVEIIKLVRSKNIPRKLICPECANTINVWNRLNATTLGKEADKLLVDWVDGTDGANVTPGVTIVEMVLKEVREAQPAANRVHVQETTDV